MPWFSLPEAGAAGQDCPGDAVLVVLRVQTQLCNTLRPCHGAAQALFIERSQALLHGDAHTGSIMVTQDTTFVIDAEFAFYGPLAFDVSKMLANLLIALFASPGLESADSPRDAQRAWILQVRDQGVRQACCPCGQQDAGLITVLAPHRMVSADWLCGRPARTRPGMELSVLYQQQGPAQPATPLLEPDRCAAQAMQQIWDGFKREFSQLWTDAVAEGKGGDLALGSLYGPNAPAGSAALQVHACFALACSTVCACRQARCSLCRRCAPPGMLAQSAVRGCGLL